jgi:hypothetical protein
MLPFCATRSCSKTRAFYQDRLGTNLAKAEKEDRFFSQEGGMNDQGLIFFLPNATWLQPPAW